VAAVLISAARMEDRQEIYKNPHTMAGFFASALLQARAAHDFLGGGLDLW
jgi:hypothetical protein